MYSKRKILVKRNNHESGVSMIGTAKNMRPRCYAQLMA